MIVAILSNDPGRIVAGGLVNSTILAAISTRVQHSLHLFILSYFIPDRDRFYRYVHLMNLFLVI
jgi:hypothetical protein